MKAIVLNQHGGPEVLEIVERPIPEPKVHELLDSGDFFGSIILDCGDNR